MTVNMASRKSSWILILLAIYTSVSLSQVDTENEAPDTDQSSPNANEVFTRQPNSTMYVTSKLNAIIDCEAKKATILVVKCLDSAINQRVTETTSGDGETLKRRVRVEIVRGQVYEILDDFDCVCEATVDGEIITSRTARIKIAYMRKAFNDIPIEDSVEYMTPGRLACSPPQAVPRPSVKWEKNGRPLNKTSINYIITSEGSLLINQATYADEGNYTCIATNSFFTRRTLPVHLYVHTNGNWSPWASWSSCDATHCGNGQQRRHRQCDAPQPSGRRGRPCEGESVQSSPCTKQCPPGAATPDETIATVKGAWSGWGQWQPCENCKRYRFRQCDNPAPSESSGSCPGIDVQSDNCTGQCVLGVDYVSPASKQEDESQNIILWVVLCAAVALFAIILVIIVMCLMKKKNQRNTMFEMEVNNPDESTSDSEKFTHGQLAHSIQPDLTKSMPLRHPRSYSSRQNSVENTVEKVPMLHSPTTHPQRDYYMQISPGNSTDHHDYMQIGQNDVESGDDKASQQSSSPESGICNSCDRQSLLSSHLPSQIDNDALSWGNVTHTGGRLSVHDSGVSITIPEGAIGRNHNEEVFIAALREDKDKPVLLDKQTILSPVLLCGPQANTFNKSLILSFDHCASLKLGQWKLSIYCSHSAYDAQPQWERLVTLNQEILHAPVFCQMDNTRCHVMVDQLASRYCLVGESMYGSKGVKYHKLAAFATPFTGSMEYNVRVYVLPDTQDALHCVKQQEDKLGSKLIDKPKQIPFQDGGNNLCLMIDSLAPGWVSKLPAQYQEIPFRHVWNGHSNLHCSFSFERASNQPQLTLSCKIQVYQKSVLSNRQTINITSNLESSFKLMSQKDLSSTVTVNTQSSSGCGSMVTLDHPAQQIFKLPTSVKKKLASHLDTPCIRGNDWRMLAAALSSDRQLNFFATKPSPTEAILDLWEARNNTEELSVSELTNILRVMGRQDAANIMEREIKSNAWV